LLPSIGGSIGGWSIGDQPMLRAATERSLAVEGAFGSGSFPLVPYSNRIAAGKFTWRGRHYSLARNFLPEPHAIHGVGFDRPWSVMACDDRSASLSLTHAPDSGWPWPFRACQRYALCDDSLRIDMEVVNLAPLAVPLAFGHHPYFPRDGAQLRFKARQVWLSDGEGLPALPVKPFGKYDFSSLRRLSKGGIDHCFAGWDGNAWISWDGAARALEIEASESLRCAVVYIRDGLSGFCFEPVGHLNDALNRRTDFGMPVIEPTEAFRAHISLRAVDPAAL
jgi:aldose 1-epimerase